MLFGQEHPLTLRSMHALATTWKVQGKHEEALRLMKRCTELQSKVLCHNHPGTQGSREYVESWERSTSLVSITSGEHSKTPESEAS